ncbi:hypothetical protein JCM8202_003435 [Rhodotorula sphaerocarpa]
MKTTFKVSHSVQSGPPVLRKITSESTSISDLIATVRDRFQFAATAPLELFYRDEDGDLITLSSDGDLHELLASPVARSSAVRVEVRLAGGQPSGPGAATSPAPSSTSSTAAAGAVHLPAESPHQVTEDWTEIDSASVEDEPLLAGFSEQLYASSRRDAPEPPSAEVESVPVAVEDPAELVLPGTFTARLESLIEQDFPRGEEAPAASEKEASATPTLADTDDPAEEPLPSSEKAHPEAPHGFADHPAFSDLPASLSSILSGLGTHAGSFGEQLAALAGTRGSALGRLACLLSNPSAAVSSGAIDLSDVPASLSRVGIDVSAAVQEVLQSVRSEADGVRDDFERFKREVEAQKLKFEREMRAALEEAKRAREEAAAAAAAGSAQQSEKPGTSSAATGECPGANSNRYGPSGRYGPCFAGNKAGTSDWTGGCRSHGAGSRGRRGGIGFRGGGGHSWWAGPSASMSDLPSSMPGTFAWSAPRPPPPAPAAGPSKETEVPEASSAPPPQGPAETTQSTEGLDDKPVLLTTFLGAARQIGFDVDDAGIRTALTDVWCDCNGRGMSDMLDKACEQLFS